MKIIKISLAIAVVGLISFFVINSLVPSQNLETPPPAKNQFTASIESEIIVLQNLPINRFHIKEYNEITFHIADFYKKSRLGTNKVEKDQ